MSSSGATFIIPTVQGGPLLEECLRSIRCQTETDYDIIVVDNSGKSVAAGLASPPQLRVIENPSNVGFGGAVNQAALLSKARYLAVVNDDATLDSGWLRAMEKAMESTKRVGMCASRIYQADAGKRELLDSAGMLVCPDGSSKQRGFGEPGSRFATGEQALLPSGAAACYRRSMFEKLGGFDEKFFLYCEDTDLGLRAAWAGWNCRYVPEAIVHHHYSATAGRVSPLKVYYVERNRLFVLLKNFPLRMLLGAPTATLERYFWHAMAMGSGDSAAARFRRANSPWQLVFILARAHLALLKYGPEMLRQRKRIRRHARLTVGEFTALCERFAISPRQVATQ